MSFAPGDPMDITLGADVVIAAGKELSRFRKREKRYRREIADLTAKLDEARAQATLTEAGQAVEVELLTLARAGVGARHGHA